MLGCTAGAETNILVVGPIKLVDERDNAVAGVAESFLGTVGMLWVPGSDNIELGMAWVGGNSLEALVLVELEVRRVERGALMKRV